MISSYSSAAARSTLAYLIDKRREGRGLRDTQQAEAVRPPPSRDTDIDQR